MAKLCWMTVILMLVVSCSVRSFGQQLYISNEPQKSLQLMDLGTSKITTLYNIGADPDDLTTNAAGQLIYSVPSLGTVNLYDPTTKQNRTLASGLKYARDLVIEPGGQSMLIAIYSPGKIMRYNFATGATSLLVSKLVTCDGIAYDPFGNLYAVANHNTIVQIHPVSGTILGKLTLEPHVGVNGGDGMVYDSYTGSLWATHDGTTGFGLLQIPVTATGFSQSGFSFYATPGVRALDGVKSDGKGNLYIGAIHTVAVYNIPTNTVTKNIIANGADGVALVPGTF